MRLSVCMIVRDEAENLPGAIQTLGDLADELVIVDTGSLDNTVQIARDAGAKVAEIRWADDFAAARNESLRLATGDWIFILDADDRILDSQMADFHNFKNNFLTTDQANVYFIQVVSPGQSIVWQPRFFRNRCGVQFERPLHETIMPSIEGWKDHMYINDLQIKHIGYPPEGITPERARRNLRILRSYAEMRPDKYYWCHCHIGHNLISLGEDQAGVESLEAALSMPDDLIEIVRYEATLALLRTYARLGGGYVDKAKTLVSRALGEFPNGRHLHYLATSCFLDWGELKKALRCLLAGEEKQAYGWMMSREDEIQIKDRLVAEMNEKIDRPNEMARDVLAGLAGNA